MTTLGSSDQQAAAISKQRRSPPHGSIAGGPFPATTFACSRAISSSSSRRAEIVTYKPTP
jgi:hypothetical protein